MSLTDCDGEVGRDGECRREGYMILFLSLCLTAACSVEVQPRRRAVFARPREAPFGEEELVSYGGSLDDVLCVEVL